MRITAIELLHISLSLSLSLSLCDVYVCVCVFPTGTSSVKLESKAHEKRKLTKQYSSESGYLQPPPPPSYTPLPPNSFSDTVFTDLNLTHEHKPLDDHEYVTLDQLSNGRGKTHNEVSENEEKRKEAKNEEKRKKMLAS